MDKYGKTALIKVGNTDKKSGVPAYGREG